MKRIIIKSCLRSGAGCLALLICGCISLPNSPGSPNPKFYVLSAAIDEARVSQKITIAPGIIIGIGPVKIPGYLNRPQMVTRDKEGMLKFDEFDRWGESLDLGIARVVREDLTVILPGEKLTLYPWNPSMAVKYQVVAEVVQLDSELDREMTLVVQWMIIDVQNSKTVMIKRSEFRTVLMPQNDTGMAKTLSAACASLSGQIAQALATL